MRKRKQVSTTTEGTKSLKKAILFCVAVILLILFSLLFRLTLLIKESTYNGQNRYTIGFISDEKLSGILSFDPEQKNVSILTISGSRQNKSLQQLLSIPIDGYVTLSKGQEIGSDPSTLLFSLLLHPGLKKERTNEVDIMRLLLFSKKLAPKDITEKKLLLPVENSVIDDISSQLFIDTAIVDEQISIEIINGTNVPGLGRRLERLVKNAGGNVVAVSNSSSVVRSSKIVYFEKESYTSKKLQHILKYPTEVSMRQSIADIIIYIGEDQKEPRLF